MTLVKAKPAESFMKILFVVTIQMPSALHTRGAVLSNVSNVILFNNDFL